MVVVRSDISDLKYPEDRNCADWILDQISDQTDNIALINSETDERYSYRELRRLVPRVSSNLVRCGVEAGDVVCVLARNTPEYAILVLAALQAGLVISGINPELTPEEIKRQFDDAGVTYVFTQPEFLHKIRTTGTAFDKLKKVFVQGEAADCVSYSSLLQEVTAAQADSGDKIGCPIDAQNTVALLPYSSGTTGLPKGVMISHYNVMANLMQIGHPESCLLQREGSVIVEYAPFYHVGGLMVGLLSTLLMRGTVVAMPTFDYHKYLCLIEKYQATFFKSVPPVLLRLSKDPDLHRYNLSSLTAGVVGAAPTPPEVLLQARRKLGIEDFSQAWGMSETTAVGTLSPPNLPIKPASVGKLPPDTQAKVVDPDTLEDLDLGELGELWLRGPQVMLGYWRKPKQTRDTITRDSWLRTGDIAYIDSDHYIFIVDRLKELIKVNGFQTIYQVAPAELEAVVLSHPGVMDAAVVGVKDKVAGELPRAYIVLWDTHTKTVSADDIMNHVNGHVAWYKQLKGGVVFVKEIPKSPAGKTLHRLVQPIYQIPVYPNIFHIKGTNGYWSRDLVSELLF